MDRGGNLVEIFQEIETWSALAHTYGALAVWDVFTAAGYVQGLKHVLPTVVRDALRSSPGGDERPARWGPMGTLEGPVRNAKRVAPEDGVVPGG